MNRTIIIGLCFCFVISCKKENATTKKIAKNIEINMVDEVKLSGGSLYRIDSFPTTTIKSRPIDIWLPDGYTETKKYAVLYMHDGQMLFDSTTTWNKQEWMVDEWASKLMKEGKTKDFIVVAVHNISEIRWNDYFPQKAFDYLTEEDKKSIFDDAMNNDQNANLNADNYLKFLTQELKPFIDSTYSVLPELENTFVSGSSMGGLISMYAIFEYPDVYGGAACISTHWPGASPRENNPIPEAFFKYMRAHLPSASNHKLYFDFGTETLDQFYPQYEDEVNEIFLEKGYDEINFKNLKFEGMDHSENSWNQRLDKPFTFLLKK
ncbi:MAG: alpha/beta hydrolase [Flavobacteriaceae bacterium]|nr:alpha/beta hydrolase [Flavobacteriaceae bacterium]